MLLFPCYSESMIDILIWSLALSLAINGSMFLVAYHLKSDKLTDASYAVSFIALAAFIYSQSSGQALHILELALVCLWALRIGGFLLYRVIKNGKDQRFDGIRENFWKFGQFWLGQGFTAWLLLLPAALAAQHQQAGLHTLTLVGLVVWAIGFLLETTADLQKYRFSQQPKNKNTWIDSGVWRYSRHPNYFGEILVWIGLYLCALQALTTSGKIVSVLSPLFIMALLLFVSGIPILEKSADKRWGSDPKYKQYKKRTSVLIPLPKRGA